MCFGGSAQQSNAAPYARSALQQSQQLRYVQVCSSIDLSPVDSLLHGTSPLGPQEAPWGVSCHLAWPLQHVGAGQLLIGHKHLLVLHCCHLHACAALALFSRHLQCKCKLTCCHAHHLLSHTVHVATFHCASRAGARTVLHAFA